jgi:hypothetical protein
MAIPGLDGSDRSHNPKVRTARRSAAMWNTCSTSPPMRGFESLTGYSRFTRRFALHG